MKWIKINHTSGIDIINVEQLYRIKPASSNNVEFYTTGSSTATVLTFTNSTERDKAIEKLQKTLDSLNLDRIVI